MRGVGEARGNAIVLGEIEVDDAVGAGVGPAHAGRRARLQQPSRKKPVMGSVPQGSSSSPSMRKDSSAFPAAHDKGLR